MLVLFESWLPSDRLESLWKGTRSSGFDGQPRHLFTDMVILFRAWLHAPLCGKRKITLWWCALIWRYESIRLLLRRTFSCDSGRSLQTHLQPARPLHLPSLKLSINTEEYPRIWLPHTNRCTTTQTHKRRHRFSRLVLTKCFPLTGQFVWFLLLFHCVGIDVLYLHGKLALCNQ